MQGINSTPMHPARHMQQQQQQRQIQAQQHVQYGQGQEQQHMQELRAMEGFEGLGHEEGEEEDDLHVNQPDDALLIMEVRGGNSVRDKCEGEAARVRLSREGGGWLACKPARRRAAHHGGERKGVGEGQV